MTVQHISNALKDSAIALDKFIENPSNLELMQVSIDQMVKTIQTGGRILSCGNGGSMCDSMHFVEELTGRYRKDRRPLAAMSMGDASHITCVANDYGYEFIFSRHVEAWGRKGDVLLAISTSGNSQNVILAVEAAKKAGMSVIGLLGKTGGKLKAMVDYPIVVECDVTDRIQEVHIKIIHNFIEGIERQIFPEHYNQ